MKAINLIKKFLPAAMLFFLVLGLFNVGSYDTQNDLAILTPAVALATESSSSSSTYTYKSCEVNANAYSVNYGSDLVISWNTQGYSNITLNGEVVSGSNGTKTFTNIKANTTYTLYATNLGSNSSCTTSVTVYCIPTPAPTCNLTPTTKTVKEGESVNLNWSTTNAANTTLTGFGTVANSGSQNTGALTTSKNYTLTVTGLNGSTVSCNSNITVEKIVIPAPTCDLTPATKTIIEGGSVTLNWSTANAASVTLSNFGTVANSGSQNTGALTTNKNYVLTVIGLNGSIISCNSAITVDKVVVPAPTCDLTPATKTIKEGESVNLIWNTTNAASVTLTNFGTVANSGSQNTGTLTANKGYVLTVIGLNGNTVTCNSNITVEKIVIPAPTCNLTPTTKTVKEGESVNLNWSTTNAANTTLTGFGTVANSGSQNTGALTTSKNYTLTVTGLNGSTVSCNSNITVENTPPAPVCVAFTVNPSTIVRGASANLSWQTKNANRVVIDNAIGEVSATGTYSVTPLHTTEFTLKVYGQNDQEAVCKTTVIVNEPPVVLLPECSAFSASPAVLPANGGNTTLSWQTKNAESVSISPTIGSVDKNGTKSVSVSTTTTYTLTVLGVGTNTTSCTTKVEVQPVVPVPLTCGNNVNLTMSPTSVSRGNSATLNWSTTGVTSVSFNQGITATGLSGSLSVAPDNSTTYNMTVSDGKTTVSCPVTLNVTTGGGGGGGGSSSPVCELSVSKNRINRGEEITLRWDTSRASDIEIVDSFRNVIVTTKNLLSSDKNDLFDGSVRVSPKQDTTYYLTAERGSRDEECKVSVDVQDSVVLSQVRTQQPLIAGISLSQVPYTGFAAGPLMTITFYLLLVAWALYVAYLIVIKRDSVGGLKLAAVPMVAGPETIRPDVFVASVKVPEVRSTLNLPDNLPVGNPVVGYASIASVAGETASISTSPHNADDRTVTAIENHAHKRKVLLSSDAIRHFVGTTTNEEERIDALDDVIALSKAQFPSEDGWVVINEKRMRELCVTCSVNQIKSSVAPYVPAVIPEGSGSLAEAIVTGNVIAAYEMIGNRPMFALADASADLDSIYRARKGNDVTISDMLAKESARLSDEQIMQMIKALTSALDGVYTDEASAVKMAIMKAVKVAA